MLMTDEKTKVQQIAEEKGWSFKKYAGRALLSGLSYQTAKDVWYGVKGDRGYNVGTKMIIAKLLRRPVSEVFPDD